MSISLRRGSATMLGLAMATIAAGAGLANSAPGATQCGVTATTERGTLTLEGTIVSPVELSGEYRFMISSSGNGGSSNISQGGYFTAAAHEPTIIGKVTIDAGARYGVSLDVSAGGQIIACDQGAASLT